MEQSSSKYLHTSKYYHTSWEQPKMPHIVAQLSGSTNRITGHASKPLVNPSIHHLYTGNLKPAKALEG